MFSCYCSSKRLRERPTEHYCCYWLHCCYYCSPLVAAVVEPLQRPYWTMSPPIKRKQPPLLRTTRSGLEPGREDWSRLRNFLDDTTGNLSQCRTIGGNRQMLHLFQSRLMSIIQCHYLVKLSKSVSEQPTQIVRLWILNTIDIDRIFFDK